MFASSGLQLQQHLEAAACNQGGTGTNGTNIFINLGNVNNGNKDDISNTQAKNEIYTSDGFLKSIMFISMGSFTDIIQRVADARAENGAEQSRLGMANELLIQNQTNLEAAHGRIMDADVASNHPDSPDKMFWFNLLQPWSHRPIS